jgi:hypothetical protein
MSDSPQHPASDHDHATKCHVHIASIVMECDGTTNLTYYRSDASGTTSNVSGGKWNFTINTRSSLSSPHASTTNDIKNYVELLGHHLLMLHWNRGLGEWIRPHLQLPTGTKAVAKDWTWRLLLSIHSKKLDAITSSKFGRSWTTLH